MAWCSAIQLSNAEAQLQLLIQVLSNAAINIPVKAQQVIPISWKVDHVNNLILLAKKITYKIVDF